MGGGGGVNVGLEEALVGEGSTGFVPGCVGGIVALVGVLVAAGAMAPAGTHNSWPMLRVMLERQLISWR